MSYYGMNRHTGRRINDEGDHISQSIPVIITTATGLRIKRRTFGALVPELIDQPGNPVTRMRVMSATIMAILKWEPRISIKTVSLAVNMEGKAQIEAHAVRKNGPRKGESIRLQVLLT